MHLPLKYALACMIATLFAVANAQEESVQPEEDRGFQHSVGLNATGLLRTVLNSEESEDDLPFLVIYDWDLGKMHLRAGAGPEFSTETTVHDGFTDSQENTFFRIDTRLGIGFDILDNTKWYIQVGVDAVGKYVSDVETIDTGFDAVSDELETWSIGAGPFVQLAFRISPRVSVSTEAAFYSRYFETTRTETFENFPDFNNELSNTTGWTLDTFLPSSVFLQFHF